MQEHWDGVFTTQPDRFGSEPSISAKVAAEAFTRLRVPAPDILDLGSGSGRDSLFFAQRGMHVVALDFSQVALDALQRTARLAGLSQSIQTVRHDVREPLPFQDAAFDACYSHMLYCMDFTLDELSAMSAEVRRILKPGGIHVYTARTTKDPDFGVGTHRGEQRYEDEGFTVHFFDRRMVERLAAGFRLLEVREFEEGALPRRLFTVTLEAALTR
ncbi:MAG: class I SAM-dependent methyltransferase [Vulcanimicrobiaceae bacterium]